MSVGGKREKTTAGAGLLPSGDGFFVFFIFFYFAALGDIHISWECDVYSLDLFFFMEERLDFYWTDDRCEMKVELVCKGDRSAITRDLELLCKSWSVSDEWILEDVASVN